MSNKTYQCVILAPLVIEVQAETQSQALRLARARRHIVANDLKPPLRLTDDGTDLVVLSVSWDEEQEQGAQQA